MNSTTYTRSAVFPVAAILSILPGGIGCQSAGRSNWVEPVVAPISTPQFVYHVSVPPAWTERRELPNTASVDKPTRYLYPRYDYARRHRQGWEDCVADVLTGAVIRQDEVLQDRFHGYDAEEAGYRDGYLQARDDIDQLFERFSELEVLQHLETLRE